MGEKKLGKEEIPFRTGKAWHFLGSRNLFELLVILVYQKTVYLWCFQWWKNGVSSNRDSNELQLGVPPTSSPKKNSNLKLEKPLKLLVLWPSPDEEEWNDGIFIGWCGFVFSWMWCSCDGYIPSLKWWKQKSFVQNCDLNRNILMMLLFNTCFEVRICKCPYCRILDIADISDFLMLKGLVEAFLFWCQSNPATPPPSALGLKRKSLKPKIDDTPLVSSFI